MPSWVAEQQPEYRSTLRKEIAEIPSSLLVTVIKASEVQHCSVCASSPNVKNYIVGILNRGRSIIKRRWFLHYNSKVRFTHFIRISFSSSKYGVAGNNADKKGNVIIFPARWTRPYSSVGVTRQHASNLKCEKPPWTGTDLVSIDLVSPWSRWKHSANQASRTSVRERSRTGRASDVKRKKKDIKNSGKAVRFSKTGRYFN